MGAAGFPRAVRLVRSVEFTALRKENFRFSSHYFHFLYRYTSSATARLGMVVSRRVSKRAFVRNSIKRQIRESFRHRRLALPAVDVLVIAKTQASTNAPLILRHDLTQLWDKLVEMKLSPSNTKKD